MMDFSQNIVVLSPASASQIHLLCLHLPFVTRVTVLGSQGVWPKSKALVGALN